MSDFTWPVIDGDIAVLRTLWRRKAEIANDPVMEARRRLWRRHAALDSQRPMILGGDGGGVR